LAAGATAVTLNTGLNFVASAGAGAGVASGGGANWRIYSTTPSFDQGLAKLKAIAEG
jgi:hypothetical protein